MMRRRPLVLAGWAAPWLARRLAPALVPLLAADASAAQRASLHDPLRLGVDLALAESGLAGALQRAFGRDTGIAVKLIPQPALPMLLALERGELDAALSNTPQSEAALLDKGLAHDRRLVARASCALVGPAPIGRTADPAAVNTLKDIGQALRQLRDAAATNPEIRFLHPNDQSGAHVAEQAAWRAAGVAPVAPWYQGAKAGESFVQQARAAGAYAIVERGSWAVQGGAPLALLLTEDPRLDGEVHVLRSFRSSHPAGKIFGQWIAGRRGARVVARVRGYQAPPR